MRAIEAIADAGYYRGTDLLTCRDRGVTALMPRANTSNAKADGRFSKEAFVYLPDRDAYRCPAGKLLTRRYLRDTQRRITKLNVLKDRKYLLQSGAYPPARTHNLSQVLY